ncbi:DgyrCDS13793 [Dimorphilus gyrociliatus]|uniref:DgyrCDS13793 n=1 Tax=Dimorphilus gyrociliatus TaxID=2664684 RepID=A0A7I8WBS1_9ANNE|nr:DgyrCDS13793 [Dimorphilus gyrociliatus]
MASSADIEAISSLIDQLRVVKQGKPTIYEIAYKILIKGNLNHEIQDKEMLLYRRILQFVGNSSTFDEESILLKLFQENFNQITLIEDTKCIIYIQMMTNNFIEKLLKMDNYLEQLKPIMDFIFKTWECSEWAKYVIEKCCANEDFLMLYYPTIESQNRYILLDMMICQLESDNEPFIHLKNVLFVSSQFTDLQITSVDILTYAIYLRKYLEILCKASCMDKYNMLKEEKSLLLKTIDFLKFIYECSESGKEEFKTISKLSEFDKESDDFRVHGLKRDLIRLIANFVYKHKTNQNLAKDVLPIILCHTQVDARNPFCQNWAIVAVRNLLEDNDENKSFLSSLSLQQISQDVNDFRKYGIEAEVVDGRIVNKLFHSSTPRLDEYGGRHTVTLIPGDGAGPELTNYVKTVFAAANAPVDFETVKLDQTVTDPREVDNAFLSIQRNGVALKGNLRSSKIPRMSNVELRSELELYAHVVRCKTIPGVPARMDNVDCVIIRENTEGEYSQLEHENAKGVVESLKIITKKKSTRIAKYAFDHAKKYNRKKVTAVHKANIMKLGDGLFLECCREVAKEYPDIEFNDMIVDNASMQMVSKPNQFDVIVLPNLYGMILANIACGLVGGAGVVPGSNIGDNCAVFETGTRSTGDSIAGLNIANPCAMLFASSSLLAHIGLTKHSDCIRKATEEAVATVHTPDLGGSATSEEFVDKVLSLLKVPDFN